MARKKTSRKRKKKPPFRPIKWLAKWALRAFAGAVVIAVIIIMLGTVINPPVTPYMWSENRRLGGVEHKWIAIEKIAPVMQRSVIAAEDANFCMHWGFDVHQIRAAIKSGQRRGASTISQQVVKNLYLWQGRSWLRKGLEATLTPLLEAVWSKRRILEVYLNIAEMGEGVFGVQAASQTAFGINADALDPVQAAAIAATLPAPKTRSAVHLSPALQKRAAAIADGAALIRTDGRAGCFED